MDKKHHDNLYKRLYISYEDLLLASEFLDFIIKNKLHYTRLEKRGKIYSRQAAYTISLIVSYSRPFSKTGGHISLSEKFVRFDDEKHRILHRHILELRNEIYAHSDLDRYDVYKVENGFTIFGEPFFMLTEDQANNLRIMIKELLEKIAMRKREMEN